MSTYTDLHNCTKETLTVGYCNRITPQKVHFVNPENTYSGTFIGKLSTSGALDFKGGTITDSILSNSVLDNVTFKNGMKIDDIKQDIIDLCSQLAEEAFGRKETDDLISVNLQTMIKDESVYRENADILLSTKLQEAIDNEEDARLESDQSLSVAIETLSVQLSTELSSEISSRLSADEELERRANDKMLHDRHFEMHIIDNRQFPIKLRDYAINTYINNCTNAYVYLNGDVNSAPIGCITNTRTEGNEITSFVFNAYADHPDTSALTAGGIFTYNFDKETTSRRTGVGDFAISYEAASLTSLDNMRFVIDIIATEPSDEDNAIISFAQTAKKDILTLFIPNKSEQIPNDYRNSSSKFILNFKLMTESLQDGSFVQLDLISKQADFYNVDKFYYCNKEVDKIFIKKNKWSTLRFEEIRPHRYIISDLDNSEIDWRLKWLHNELSSFEASASNAIEKLSDDMEFLLSVDREHMSYKGTLPYMPAKYDAEGRFVEGVKLSAFIGQSPLIKNGMLKLGDTFKLSAAQYGDDEVYDKNGHRIYLGENDYFVVNSMLIKLEDVAVENIDIFRNSESEIGELSVQLTAQINAVSTFLSTNINALSIETAEICSEMSSVVSLSASNLCAELKATQISVDGVSSATSLSASSLCAELHAAELSTHNLSDEVSKLCSEISNDLTAKHDELKAYANEIEMSVSGVSAVVDGLSGQLGSISADICLSISQVSDYIDELAIFASNISTAVNAVCSEISDYVLSNSQYNQYLSSELSDYHNTLSGIDRKSHGYDGHISSDNLIVTDLNASIEGKHDRYYMTMDYGTIVMRKIED